MLESRSGSVEQTASLNQFSQLRDNLTPKMVHIIVYKCITKYNFRKASNQSYQPQPGVREKITVSSQVPT